MHRRSRLGEPCESSKQQREWRATRKEKGGGGAGPQYECTRADWSAWLRLGCAWAAAVCTAHLSLAVQCSAWAVRASRITARGRIVCFISRSLFLLVTSRKVERPEAGEGTAQTAARETRPRLQARLESGRSNRLFSSVGLFSELQLQHAPRQTLLAGLLAGLLAALLAGWLASLPLLSPCTFFWPLGTIEPPAFRTALARFPRPVQSSSRLKEKSNRGCSAFRHSGCEVARGCSCQRAMQAPHIPPKIARPARFLVLARLCSTDRGGMRPTGRRHQLWQPRRNAAVSARVSLVSIHSTAPPAQIERC